jgi:hypothetical protein
MEKVKATIMNGIHLKRDPRDTMSLVIKELEGVNGEGSVTRYSMQDVIDGMINTYTMSKKLGIDKNEISYYVAQMKSSEIGSSTKGFHFAAPEVQKSEGLGVGYYIASQEEREQDEASAANFYDEWPSREQTNHANLNADSSGRWYP